MVVGPPLNVISLYLPGGASMYRRVCCAVAAYSSVDCEVTLGGGGGGHEPRTVVVGPSLNGQRCGGERHPWRLTLDAGQRVNVTLVQFSVQEDQALNGDDSTSVDHQYRVSEDTATAPVRARSYYRYLV